MIGLAFLKLSAFDKTILEECPTMQYGASFIKYIAWFQIAISFFTGWVAFSLFNFSYTILNMLLAICFSFIHFVVIKSFDKWLHQYRKWGTILTITFFVCVIVFLQTVFIGNFLFKTEFEIHSILNHQQIPEYWLDKAIYYLKKPFYIFSFRNNIVSMMSIAVFIITLFIGILPFGLTFFYRKSKYYPTQKLIENFKTEHERITKK